MPGAVEVIIVLAACASVIAGLRFRVEATGGPLITFGPSDKPTKGRIVAVVFLSLFGGLGLYAIALKPGGLQVLVLAPLYYLVLLFHVASNRFIEKFVVKPAAIYFAALAVGGAVFISIPALWQALGTRTIPMMYPGGRGLRLAVDEDPFLFWWSVFGCCAWIWFVLACGKTLFVQYRRGLPLSRYEPGRNNRASRRHPSPP